MPVRAKVCLRTLLDEHFGFGCKLRIFQFGYPGAEPGRQRIYCRVSVYASKLVALKMLPSASLEKFQRNANYNFGA